MAATKMPSPVYGQRTAVMLDPAHLFFVHSITRVIYPACWPMAESHFHPFDSDVDVLTFGSVFPPSYCNLPIGYPDFLLPSLSALSVVFLVHGIE
jgi:hypothetical protein